jgi:hypothetical protein
LLLEKAFAKLNGGYQNLKKGRMKNLLTDITGIPTHKIKLQENLEGSRDELWSLLVSHLNSSAIIIAKRILKKNQFNNTNKPKDSERDFSYLTVVGMSVDCADSKMVTMKFDESEISRLNLSPDISSNINDPDYHPQQRNSMDLAELNLNASSHKVTIPFETFLEEFSCLYISVVSVEHKLNIKGKFVCRKENSAADKISFISRYCYQIDVKEETSLSVAILQEDQTPPLVREVRPNQDLGIFIFKKEESNYSCFHYETPKMQRDAIASLKMDKGTYLIVPVSLKFLKLPDVCGLDDNRQIIKDDPKFILAIQDIFEKFNMSANDQLSFKELALLFKVFDLELTEPEFHKLCKKSLPGDCANDFEPLGLGRKAFTTLFIGLLTSGKLKDSLLGVMRAFGYESSMMCFGSRLFGLSIRSSQYLPGALKDSFKDDLEELIFETLLENEGREIVSYANGNRTVTVMGYLSQ